MATSGRFSHLPPDDYQMSAQEKIDRLEQNAVESSRRSVRVLDDTLRVGVDTAIELDRQGEQLDRVDRRLDDIDADLVQSRRHVRQLRSVFGGIVNWFTKDKPVLAPTPDTDAGEEVEKSRRLRQQVEARRTASAAERSSSARSSATGSYRSEQSQQRSAYSREVDDNLAHMSAGLTRLTDLALDLNEELARQNQQIAGMAPRVEKLDTEVSHLTKVTRRIT